MQAPIEHIWSAFMQIKFVDVAPALTMLVIVVLVCYLRRGRPKSFVWVPGPSGRQYDEAFAKLRGLGLSEDEARKQLAGGWHGTNAGS